ncbi:ABC transporter ATP-binding protein [Paractinoplanes rishiriensis]|uniref:ABC transporter ATP-binding protein n=1 Tax=Paractinoplanes rishiriensis TaxID=1050105 RepID=A0A919N1I2_9ACTN|nr:ATP-binding cassette domain-containing protein [Actinoplanes rishiriensis]GIF01526.1 ABC transporter ATP-binding protein [Actinoplanes rishiriensis]
MTEPLVEVRDVSHATVLHEITLSLAPATVTVLAGRSGSGKSTLCHLIAGVMRPTEGQVLIGGKDAHPAPDWATVSLLPQRLALEPELTVAENVLLPAGVRGAFRGSAFRGAAPAGDLLDRLGLGAIAARPARDTSLGEQQRTALARALVLNPAVAVLDEPTAHQDDDHVHLVLTALAEAVRAGTLAIVATHDQRVIDVAGEVVRLRSGRVVE